jgi:lysophospholipase L1-like esterase
MKKGKMLWVVWIALIGLLGLGSVLPGSTEVCKADGKTSVFIAGDSTASFYEPSRFPRTGWGQVLQSFFSDAVIVKNEASSGRSTKSYIDEGRLDKILGQIQAGDYLFIQFGHNDEKMGDIARYTDPKTTFKSYLTQYIKGARAKGAYPVLLTPINRYKFGNDGKLVLTHGDYPQAMLELGAALQVPVIDITQKSRLLFEKLGPEKTFKLFLNLQPGESPNYPKGVKDDTHFTIAGATEIARLIVEGVREANLPLAKCLK